MTETKIRNYYVDEAGDLTLFDKRGKVMLGKNGVSNTFMIGVVRLSNPILVKETLDKLRDNLLLDPIFKNISSMQPSAKKTALLFHAKNDHPQIRQEVFNILGQFEAKVQIAIRRKSELINYAKHLQEDKQEKLSEEKIYDSLVTLLFKNMLHQADENRIIFARLGTSERRESLANAIRNAKNNFNQKWGKNYDSPTIIDVKKSSEEVGLQVIDYYLWALQRLYERNDDSFFLPLALNYSLIVDVDDKRKRWSGEWYSKKNPLTLEKIKPLIS
ncbi:DUF3800 domain-containing protein [Geminocystis herdmanii]|uniref:DUF3800 domain-containing protein n=1 Tax=Geminocystis herdmanii TaxID=669359 RepID=UPI000348741D|nr:DUF3800 domain-containing protein [Geminocystis herdmanii]